MQLRNVPLPVTAVILIIAALTVGATLKAKERPQLLVDFEVGTTASSNNASLDVTAFEDWSEAVTVEETIQSLGSGQYIQENIVIDPRKPELAYFSSAAYDDANEEEILSIYQFNAASESFIRLYHYSYAQGSSKYLHNKAWPVWQIIGYDNEQLVVLLLDGELSLTACDAPLLVGLNTPRYAALFSLDLSDPSSGLEPYAPSDDLVAQAENAQTACLVTSR